jgi:hypothetical protein
MASWKAKQISDNKLWFTTTPSLAGYITKESNLIEEVSFPNGEAQEYALDKNGYWHNVLLASPNGMRTQSHDTFSELICDQIEEKIILSDERYICSRWMLTWDSEEFCFTDAGEGIKEYIKDKYSDPNFEIKDWHKKFAEEKNIPLEDLSYVLLFHEDGRMTYKK